MGLEDLWSAIPEALEGAALRVFPSAPDLAGNTAVVARWPNDDWRSFLVLARDLEIQLVYASAYELTEEVLRPFEARLFDEDGLPADELLAARQHLGEHFAILLAFAHAGILHTCSVEADWYQRLKETDATEREVSSLSRRVEMSEKQHELETFRHESKGWAAELAENPEFCAAKNESSRRAVAARVIPRLGEHLERSGAGFDPARGHAFRIVDRAWTIASQEVIPRKLAEARANVSSIAAEIALDPDFSTMTRRDDRQRLVRRRLESDLGLRDPELVRQIEEAAQRMLVRPDQ